jgi:hypothetical protein
MSSTCASVHPLILTPHYVINIDLFISLVFLIPGWFCKWSCSINSELALFYAKAKE